MLYSKDIMRRIALLLIVLVTASANASFDLMLLPSTVDSQVRRFDPVNRIGLGSFGNLGVGSGISVNLQSANNAYVTSGNGTQVYNISTGETIGGGFVPDAITTTSLDGQTLFETWGNRIYRYDSGLNLNFGSGVIASGLVSSLSLGLNRVASFGTDSLGNFSYIIFDTNAGTIGTWQTIIPAASFGGINTIGTGFAALEGGNMRLRIPYRTNTSTDVFQTLTFINNGVLTASTQFFMTGYGAGLKSIMPGHAGFWIVGDDISSATTTRISKYLGNGGFAGTYTTTAVDVPSTRWSGANVVAPEPGSMIALGLGIAALLKRKKMRVS